MNVCVCALTCPAGRYSALCVCVFGLGVCVVVRKLHTGLQDLRMMYGETRRQIPHIRASVRDEKRVLLYNI